MGCTPAKSDQGVNFPILIISQVQASPVQINHLSHKCLSPKKLTVIKHKTNSRREGTCNYRRKSLSPLHQLDFWGTMPISVLIDRLNSFHEEVKKNGGNIQDSFEYIQDVLNEIGKDFENSPARCIKKSDKKFKAFVGKYNHGIQVFKTLGFREFDDCIKVDEDMDEHNWKVKLRDFALAVKKI